MRTDQQDGMVEAGLRTEVITRPPREDRYARLWKAGEAMQQFAGARQQPRQFRACCNRRQRAVKVGTYKQLTGLPE